jgi:hypothetical protein
VALPGAPEEVAVERVAVSPRGDAGASSRSRAVTVASTVRIEAVISGRPREATVKGDAVRPGKAVVRGSAPRSTAILRGEVAPPLLALVVVRIETAGRPPVTVAANTVHVWFRSEVKRTKRIAVSTTTARGWSEVSRRLIVVLRRDPEQVVVGIWVWIGLPRHDQPLERENVSWVGVQGAVPVVAPEEVAMGLNAANRAAGLTMRALDGLVWVRARWSWLAAGHFALPSSQSGDR